MCIGIDRSYADHPQTSDPLQTKHFQKKDRYHVDVQRKKTMENFYFSHNSLLHLMKGSKRKYRVSEHTVDSRKNWSQNNSFKKTEKNHTGSKNHIGLTQPGENQNMCQPRNTTTFGSEVGVGNRNLP